MSSPRSSAASLPGWRSHVRLSVNGSIIASLNQSGWSGAYNGEIPEAKREWNILIRQGRIWVPGTRGTSRAATSKLLPHPVVGAAE